MQERIILVGEVARDHNRNGKSIADCDHSSGAGGGRQVDGAGLDAPLIRRWQPGLRAPAWN